MLSILCHGRHEVLKASVHGAVVHGQHHEPARLHSSAQRGDGLLEMTIGLERG